MILRAVTGPTPGSVSSAAWSAALRSMRLSSRLGASIRSMPSSGTSTFVPSSSGCARLSTSLAAARSTRGAYPPAASMASPTRSPGRSRCSPGRSTAPATSTTSSLSGGATWATSPARVISAPGGSPNPSGSPSRAGSCCPSSATAPSSTMAPTASAAPAAAPPSAASSGTSHGRAGSRASSDGPGRPAGGGLGGMTGGCTPNTRPCGMASFKPSLLPAGGGGGEVVRRAARRTRPGLGGPSSNGSVTIPAARLGSRGRDAHAGYRSPLTSRLRETWFGHRGPGSQWSGPDARVSFERTTPVAAGPRSPCGASTPRRRAAGSRR